MREIVSEDDASVALSGKLVLRPIVGLVENLHPLDLEDIIINEILKHRRIGLEASRLYETWQSDPAANPLDERASAAELAYVAAMIAAHAQQTVVSTLIDVAGVVPNVPRDSQH